MSGTDVASASRTEIAWVLAGGVLAGICASGAPGWVAALVGSGAAWAGWRLVRRQRVPESPEPEFDVREFTNAFPALIAVLDAQHRYEFVNVAHERLHGKPRTELEGHHCGELLGPEVYEKIKPRIEEVLSGVRVRFDERFEHPTLDTEFHYSTLYVPRTDECGEVNGFYSLSSNVTRQKVAEEAQRSLEERAVRGQKLEGLGALAGGIAHDFNNLLVAVLGNAELAQKRLGPNSPADEELRTIQTASQRAADLCRQMLAYAGKGRFRIETVDLSSVAREMADLLRASLHKGLELRFELAHEPLPVRVDVTEIRQVILNLISNGSEAMENRTGTLCVRSGVIEASAETLAATFVNDELPGGRYAFLEVADAGIGMDEATRSRVFDPFFTTKFAGRGLGLAAVLGIVRSHAGAIDVSSTPGDGTRIRVYVPISDEPVATAEPNRRSGSAFDATGTLLLVDDEPAVRRTTRRLLESFGFDVEEAEDGQAAVETFRKRPDTFDAVILDLTMPRMNGHEAFGWIRKIRSEVPIIVFSGFSDEAVKEQFTGLSNSTFLEKPFRTAQLVDALRSVLPDAEVA